MKSFFASAFQRTGCSVNKILVLTEYGCNKVVIELRVMQFWSQIALLARPILKSRVWFQTKCIPLTSPLSSITIIDLTRGGLLHGLFDGNISMQSKFRKADIQSFKKWNLVLFSSPISTSRRWRLGVNLWGIFECLKLQSIS